MNLYLTAKLKSKDDFFQLYEKKYLNAKDEGESLIIYAMCNTKIPDRYEICNFLINEGADINVLNSQGNTLLHLALSHVQHDLNETILLCEKLIDLGCDRNHKDKKGRSALQWLINLPFSDQELLPLYDIWFKDGGIDVISKSDYGLSPLELARKFPNRAKLVEIMQKA